MYKCIIFDLDGTLLDTSYDLMQSLNLTLKSFGIDKVYSLTQTKSLLGNGLHKLIDDVFFNYYNEKINHDLAFNCFMKYYEDLFLKNSIIYPNLIETLNSLQNDGIKLCVHTNKEDKFAKPLIKKYFNDIKFEYIIGRSNCFERKPSNQAVRFIIDNLKLNDDEVLYVGDSEVDLSTAKNSNIDICLVSYGFRDKNYLSNLDYTYMVSDAKEIPHICKTNL